MNVLVSPDGREANATQVRILHKLYHNKTFFTVMHMGLSHQNKPPKYKQSTNKTEQNNTPKKTKQKTKQTKTYIRNICWYLVLKDAD